MCVERWWPIPDFRAAEADPLQSCSICAGRRVLIDLVGESVCAWCDGTGLEASVLPRPAP